MVKNNSDESIQDTGFSVAFRDAIRERGVTLAWLNARLRAHGNPVSMATLSYWRSGARRPEGPHSMAALEDIEHLLGLETATLSSLIGPSLRIGPFGAPSFPLNDRELEQAVAQSYADLGEVPPDRTRDISTHAVTEVGQDGHVVSRTIRSLIQSVGSGRVTHVPFMEASPGVSTPPPQFEVLGGGRVRQVTSHVSGEVHGFLLELERPIETAETIVIEWRVTMPADYPPSYDTGYAVSRQCRDLLLWTRFHPDAVPIWMEETDESPEKSSSTPVTVDGRTSVHQVRHRFGPGLLALRWGFDPRP